MKLLYGIIIMWLIAASMGAHAGKKIIKWVDKNGVTHYGDRPPTSTKAKKSSVLNKQGITVKKIAPKPKKTRHTEAVIEQSRYDNALLASYNSIEEIEIARKRNIKIDELTLANLEDKREKTKSNLQKNNKSLLDYAKKNQTAPTDLVKSIEINELNLANLEKKISLKKQEIEVTNARYEKDKKRYKELQSSKSGSDDSQFSNRNLAELRAWRDDTQRRLNQLELESLKYKRRGESVPHYITEDLISTTRELNNAKEEIATAESAIKNENLRLNN